MVDLLCQIEKEGLGAEEKEGLRKGVGAGAGGEGGGGGEDSAAAPSI